MKGSRGHSGRQWYLEREHQAASPMEKRCSRHLHQRIVWKGSHQKITTTQCATTLQNNIFLSYKTTTLLFTKTQRTQRTQRHSSTLYTSLATAKLACSLQSRSVVSLMAHTDLLRSIRSLVSPPACRDLQRSLRSDSVAAALFSQLL